MKIGAAQLRPCWLDPARTTDKIVNAIAQAGREGIGLLAFPEAFLSGYPFWLCRTNGAAFDDARQKRAYAQFLDAAVEVPSPLIARITEAARDHGVSVYLGLNERGRAAARGSVYCSLLAIDAARGLIGTHRKLVPTFDERLCWAPGDGQGLKVHQIGDTRVSGLNCWENWMPLARFSLYAGGTDVHVSVWPGNPAVAQNAVQLIAHEGRVWSMGVSGVLHLDDIPSDFEFRADLEAAGMQSIFSGGSQIIAPDGRVAAAATDGAEEIISHEADLATVRGERQNFDPSGHYHRPDVFRLAIDRTRHEVLLETQDPAEDEG
ncbi:nitrilase [Azorhizobium oxalatiphilum]|uniref:Nitrilase n=1 Tax=Azorhizobium oxalatiphilum TaxID=980631 RepID=A0A917FEL3_9HYPH|nr:carbon-nitrogen hydrolase family protein [Azorhizobium oxalatiphilum]GGF68153.1 nitrilase [Azorhizobium oxalatiphilum]